MIIKFEFEIHSDNTEPDRYATLYHGEIFDYADDDDDDDCVEPDVKVGEIDIYLISRGRIVDDYESLFETMDSMSSETMACYEAIIDEKTNDWKDEVQLLIGEDRMIHYDIMLIKRLELEEEFRGKGIGKRAAIEVVKTLGANCAVLVCKPFPLQYMGYGDPDHAEERAAPGFETKRLAALEKVCSFWRKVGFEKIPSSDHYAWTNDDFLVSESNG
jgi:GNAT superfamily N-acetyltransferase